MSARRRFAASIFGLMVSFSAGKSLASGDLTNTATDFSEIDAQQAEVPAMIGTVSTENGGVIILHAMYRMCPERCGYGDFLMVADDRDMSALRVRFANESNSNVIVRVKDDRGQLSFDAQLFYADTQTFTGRIVPTGAPFVVVSENYARLRGWL